MKTILETKQHPKKIDEMIDGMNCCLILCSYPHHESRVGELYNAVVPAFDEEVCAEASQVQEERFLKCSVVIISL